MINVEFVEVNVWFCGEGDFMVILFWFLGYYVVGWLVE